ncbi:MAG: hypothetical protein R3275_00100 [Saprospiraceae bacterium]|nr:hypothetical protein [Saprospiraceae bacterium]
MHDIEPFYRWQDEYVASEDERSPFYGQQYSEFAFTKKIYNYYIHPQWDEMGSKTLYLKILYTDYPRGFTVIELIGEWNDCLYNDIMYLKREIADHLAQHQINKYILLADNVLNYHADDSSYYEEWFDDIIEEGGWICLLNLHPHVEEEMRSIQMHHYVNLGETLNDINWRKLRPDYLFQLCNKLVTRQLT